jgi:hypothetical protein
MTFALTPPDEAPVHASDNPGELVEAQKGRLTCAVVLSSVFMCIEITIFAAWNRVKEMADMFALRCAHRSALPGCCV